MAKTNKVCSTCGKKYHFCPSCAADNSKPSWMNMFCSENCKDLFQTATDYFAGELTPGKAKAAVDKLDLSNKDTFKASIIKMIDELNNVQPEVEVTETENKVEAVVEEEVKQVEPEVAEITEEAEVVSTKPFGKRNKKNKFNED